MNARIGMVASVLTPLLGIGPVAATGVAVDGVRFATSGGAQTAWINDGAAEIVKGPPHVAAIDQVSGRAAGLAGN
jgi:hypothetical protein